MRHRPYIHLVWTTRGRERLIDRQLVRFLCRFLRTMARKERAYWAPLRLRSRQASYD